MKLKLSTIALLFSIAVAAQNTTTPGELKPAKDTINNKSPLFSIVDMQTFVNRLRPLVADKLTVKQWDDVVNYVNALTEQKLKQAKADAEAEKRKKDKASISTNIYYGQPGDSLAFDSTSGIMLGKKVMYNAALYPDYDDHIFEGDIKSYKLRPLVGEPIGFAGKSKKDK